MFEKPSFRDPYNENKKIEIRPNPKKNFGRKPPPTTPRPPAPSTRRVKKDNEKDSKLENSESEILDMTGDIWNTFVSLEQTHPSDIKDMTDAVHAIQKIIAMRHIRKTMPETFPIKQ